MHKLFVTLKPVVLATYCVSFIKNVYLRSSRLVGPYKKKRGKEKSRLSYQQHHKRKLFYFTLLYFTCFTPHTLLHI